MLDNTMHTLPAITPALLLERLDAIALALKESGHAMALLGLGSVGLEQYRLDSQSDLDFFAIVDPGYKARFIKQLDWLAAAHPLAWHFQNTVDGHKALMMDGVFCEFAVFEPHELAAIPFAPGRIVWSRDGVDPSLALPRKALPDQHLPDETWIVGEALSCLYVGLQRWHRGERLSAARFVQSHALDRLMELDAMRYVSIATTAGTDPFNRDRRLEQRRPELACELPALVPGYTKTPLAALAMLDSLAKRGAVLDSHLTDTIRFLATSALA